MDGNEKNRIIVTLTDGTWYEDGSGKTKEDWLNFMTWKTPTMIDWIKPNGTHAYFHSSVVHHIEEKKPNE